jgi:hypothetical protein
MAIDRTGEWWLGTDAADIDEFIHAFSESGYLASKVVRAQCSGCSGTTFRVAVDDDEGFVERCCVACGSRTAILDSEDVREDAEPDDVACPCGNKVFEVAVGFALRDNSRDVKWVYVGLRCIDDGVLGVCADWKIDESPSHHLLDSV